MEERNHISQDTLDNHKGNPAEYIASEFTAQPPVLPFMPHSVLFEKEYEMHNVEIRRLLDENKRLIEDRIISQHELGVAREELHRKNLMIANINVQHEIHCRQLMKRGLKLIDEIPSIEPLQKEVKQLHSEVTKLCVIKHDLSSQVETLMKDVARLQVENEQIHSLRDENDRLHQELLCARAAVKYEDKAKCELMDQMDTDKTDLEKLSTIEQRRVDPFCRRLDLIQQVQSASKKIVEFCSEILKQIDYDLVHCQVLFLAPTLERVQQIENVIRSLDNHNKVRILACVSNNCDKRDKHIFSAGVHIVVGTPWHVLDMLQRQEQSLNHDHIKMFVLDEADEMLSRGFNDQIYDMLQLLPAKIQVVALYATTPKDVLEIPKKFMNKPVRILVKFDELTLKCIKHFFVNVVREERKLDALFDLYKRLTITQSVIFLNDWLKVNWLTDKMRSRGHAVSATHEKMNLKTRDIIMREFCSGSSRILITTDLPARIVDAGQFIIVVNYDIPAQLENYLRRIGRSSSGQFRGNRHAINFVTADDERMFYEIKRFYNVVIDELPSSAADF